MRWIRSLTVVLLACASSAALAAPCAGFSDVSDTDVEYCAAVTYLKNNAITFGCGDGSQFCPGEPTTRLQMALFLKRLADATTSSALVPFSTGQILNGATMVSSSPVVMGFGSNTRETVDFAGESTDPPEFAGFSIPIPFDGVIENLQISADLLVASVASINSTGLQYDFTVVRASGASNNGVASNASPYLTTPLSSSLQFGFPFRVETAGTFVTAANFNPTQLAVTAGDRIGIRVRTAPFTDPSASDITQLSFSATFTYTH